MGSTLVDVEPITKLAEALDVSDQARVITVAHAPWKIVHTNKGAPPAPAHTHTRANTHATPLIRARGRPQPGTT